MFTSLSLPFHDHSKSFVKDSQSTILFLALFLVRNPIQADLINLGIGSLGLILCIQAIFSHVCLHQSFPVSCYVEVASWYVLSLVGIKILKHHGKTSKQEHSKRLHHVETETKKVLTILTQVQNSLQENYDQATPPVATASASKGDDLMRKLKLLKFQALLNLKKTPTNKITSSTSIKTSGDTPPVFNSPTNKKRLFSNAGNKMLSPTLRRFSKSYVKKNTAVLDPQKAILIQKIEAYDLAPGAEKIQKDKRWSLTPDDLDDIMQGIMNKPNMFWLPTFFNQYKNNRDSGIRDLFPKESKDFMTPVNHFEGPHNKTFADDLSITKQNTFELDLKFIDLNPLNDYLINVCENWNYDVFLLHTLTNGNVVIEFGYCIFRKFQSFLILIFFLYFPPPPFLILIFFLYFCIHPPPPSNPIFYSKN